MPSFPGPAIRAPVVMVILRMQEVAPMIYVKYRNDVKFIEPNERLHSELRIGHVGISFGADLPSYNGEEKFR
jgi:hypothetical protein